jgi:hypothetical protein
MEVVEGQSHDVVGEHHLDPLLFLSPSYKLRMVDSVSNEREAWQQPLGGVRLLIDCSVRQNRE